MALASSPKLLIADEPTTALDVTVQAEIIDLMEEIQSRLGMGLLMITHDMGIVAETADDVVVMRDGQVVEHRAVHDLFAAPSNEYTRKLLEAVPHLGRPERFDSIFVQEPNRQATPDGNVKDRQVLAVDNLTVTYKGRGRNADYTAVSGVSFAVSPGEIVGLVGESGSGKSTIGRTILGLNQIADGDVTLLGTSIKGCSHKVMRKLRRDAGIVFQDPASSLNPRVPIGVTVVDPLRLHGVERNPQRLHQRARELLDSVGLPPDWTSRYPHELSGGQRQRVGIARAIAMRPKILVADEPTSALDVSVQATVLALLKDLQAELGFSCLFISHDLAVVEILADRIIVLNQGAIVEQGATRQILNDPQEAYTRKLIAAAPVPDPVEQRARRTQRLSAAAS
jgi:peptide/nickel transport system ATP-binding protein